jgi:CRISPR-associated endonuclease/helicase Cas3
MLIMGYQSFFAQAMDGRHAFHYQSYLGESEWPDVMHVPTGMGKTAAVTIAWLYKRGWRFGRRENTPDAQTPRRLVWCLPMRVLVEQTENNIRQWVRQLGIYGENVGEGRVSLHVLMGGADDVMSWAEYPEEDMILIGTQDMLLSRALMRGYGMSRYLWPIHFSLLHNDSLWVFDEVQLMGAGLATSAQLEAFRRGYPIAKESRTLWLSATLDPQWLATVDMKPYLETLRTLTIGDMDRRQAGDRLKAVKHVSVARLVLTKKAGNQKGLQAYLAELRDLVLENHDKNTQTLVIVNRVERAQGLYRLLREQHPQQRDLLIHARFRAAERRQQTKRLLDEDAADRIIVATQAIEAGVDISSRVLLTELAPWPSMVQRFGRCNRYGEHNVKGARILWVDIAEDADALPYCHEELAGAREKMTELADAGPDVLPPTDEQRLLSAVLRRKDLLDLFNTDPDLSGFDVDVSDYIRDSSRPGLQVFWREFENPNLSAPEGRPEGKPLRDELCPVSMSQAKDIHKRGAWYWDTLGDKKQAGRWVRLDRDPRPGMTLLLSAADGGYDEEVGYEAKPKKKRAVSVIGTVAPPKEPAYPDDWRSRQNKHVFLDVHLGHVAKQAKALCEALGETAYKTSVVRASRWHDRGKTHEIFDATMHACDKAPAGFLAKSPCSGRHSRRFFRHELASMLGWLNQHDGEAVADLIAYLIAAHHGKVRMSLRAMPDEEAVAGVKRFARGVWEGDMLPALDFDGEQSAETRLQLALMEIGQGEQGPSWTERTLKLLEEHGPFRLAWLETLVRLADWRASAEEQRTT